MMPSKYSLFYKLLIVYFFNRFQGIEIKEKKAYMDLPTVGYQGFKS